MDTLLVLHDLYYPGWVVEIDGTAAPILRAGLLFRAVAVPAGSHRVTFRFEPFSRAALSALFPVWPTPNESSRDPRSQWRRPGS
jgi:uncharacterized membrane protein YfhO